MGGRSEYESGSPAGPLTMNGQRGPADYPIAHTPVVASSKREALPAVEADEEQPAPVPRPPARPGRAAAEPVSVRTLFLAGIALMAVVAGALLAWQLLHVVLLVLTAVVLGEGLRPAVDHLHERRLPYGLAIAVVYLVLIAATLGILVLLTRPIAGQAGSVVAALPIYETTVQANVGQLLTALHIDSGVLNQLVGAVLGQASRVALTVLEVGGGLLSLVSDVLTVLLLSVTWLGVSRDLRRWVLTLVPQQRRTFASGLFGAIGAGFAGYVRGVCVNMVAIGLLAWVACSVLRLPVPVLLGIAAGLCELIPMLGPFLGAVPAVALGFTVSAWYPLIVAGAFLIIQQVESNVLTPVVMRSQVGLRPFPLLVALLIGGSIAGVWGALVAVPVGSAVQVVVVRVVAPAIRAREAGGHF
jgi:predicted PurR-regulated permease PerM